LPASSQVSAWTPSRHSLSWRLTVTIVVIGVAVMALFSWTAYRVVEMALVRTAGDRAQRLSARRARLLGRVEGLSGRS